MHPCHRAVANTPPSGSPLRSVCDAPCCLHPAPKSSALGRDFSRLLCVYLSLRPDDLLTILKMALSIDRDLVSLFPSIQATRFLTFTSVGLPPTEHISVPLSFLVVPELNLHGLLPRCVRFAPTSPPVNGNTRFRPVCSTVTGRDLHPLDSIKKFHGLIFGSSSSRLFPAR